MRVALLSRSAHPLHPPGGMERAVFLLATHLQRRGVETVLVTREATRAGEFPGRAITVPWASRPGLRHGKVLDRTLHYPAFALRVGEVAASLVRAGEADVVDAQGLTALGYGRARRRDRSLRAPLVMNPQGMEEHRTRGLKRLALSRLVRLSREAARLADRVVATDEATRAEVPLLLGVPAEKVVVLPNGIDLEAIAALTPAEPRAVAESAVPGLRAGAFLLLSVGRLEAYKGFGDVLGALARLSARGVLPGSWVWTIVGRGPEAGRIAARVPAALRGHVHLAGEVEERVLHALYARADVFVHATRGEGSSLVTLEAMAHGRAVVATAAGGIPDKITDGVTGRLVAPGDMDALASAIGDLATNGETRRRLGDAARRRVEEAFSWPALVDRTLALYEALVAGARA